MPCRQTDNLHRGRVSAGGAYYFVTFVTHNRTPWLAPSEACAVMRDVLLTNYHWGDGILVAATVMPDHVHVLYQLGVRLPIGRVVSRWKTQARKRCGYQGKWQRDFWEHRIRDDEKLEDYGLYLFLNPYRAGLIGADKTWPGWCCSCPERFEFTVSLQETGGPQPEWIDRFDERFADLITGNPKTT